MLEKLYIAVALFVVGMGLLYLYRTSEVGDLNAVIFISSPVPVYSPPFTE